MLLCLNCHIANLFASLEISLPYQAVYYYLSDNLVSGPSFVPTVIAALHPSNINKTIFYQFNPNAEVHMLRSVDFMSEEDRMHYAYLTEFLQQLNASGLPSALFCLKVGYPVILLRNLDPGEGLCNRTRM